MSKPRERDWRILIIDDSPEDCEIYRYYLSRDEKHKFSVVTEPSGESGYRACLSEKPDCVLLDYKLPDSDGLEILKRLERSGAIGEIPVVMLTGRGDERVAVEAMKHGAMDYLIKGTLKPDALSNAIRNAVERHGHCLDLEAQVRELRKSNMELQLIASGPAGSEAKYRRIFDANIIGVYFWHVDGAITEANDAFLDMIGHRRKDVSQGLLNWRALTPPEFAPLNDLAVNRMRTGGSCPPHEKEFIVQGGGRVGVLWGGAFLEGSSTHGVGLVIDMTTRKLTERALRESERSFRNLSESSSVLISAFDESGKPLYFNPAWEIFMGMTTRELTELNWSRHIHLDDLVNFMEAWNEALKTHQPLRLAYRLKDGQGVHRWMLSIVTPCRGGDGGFEGYIGHTIDITDLKNREIELEASKNEAETAKEQTEIANQRKSQFLANMSHELRTPLNAIIGFSEMLEAGMAGDLTEKQSRYVSNVATSGHHLLNMVNDILDLSKVEAGKAKISPEWVDLEALVYELQNTVHAIASKRGVLIRFDLRPVIQGIVADPIRLRQIFFNLVSNAIKFNKEGGEVAVVFYKSEDGNFLVCEVRDTGVGIPRENLRQLFSEFYQVNSSFSKSEQGTGLGLSLTKRLIELHGGCISVESEVGVGSTFRFKLPF